MTSIPLPSSLPRPPDELGRLERTWKTPAGWRFFSTVNNTNIGLLYIGTALLFFLLAFDTLARFRIRSARAMA